jgi:hypothetical protein
MTAASAGPAVIALRTVSPTVLSGVSAVISHDGVTREGDVRKLLRRHGDEDGYEDGYGDGYGDGIVAQSS